MNEHFSHMLLKDGIVACGHSSPFMATTETWLYTTCPACRKVLDDLVTKVSGEPAKDKRK